MSYIDEHLIPGEEVVYEGRISLYSMSNYLTFGVLGLTCIFYRSNWMLLPFAGGVACFIVVLMRYATTELAVTNKRVISKHGWVARHTVEISLGRVEGVEVQQTFNQRMLDYGSVFVSGTGSHKARISNVAEPMAFRAAFLEALDRHERGAVNPLPEGDPEGEGPGDRPGGAEVQAVVPAGTLSA